MADINYQGGRKPVWKQAMSKSLDPVVNRVPAGQRTLGEFHPTCRRPPAVSTG